MKKLYKKAEKYYTQNEILFCSLFTFFLVLSILMIVDNTIFVWDSAATYRFSMIFVEGDGFSLVRPFGGIRGIVLPLILLPFNLIADFIWGETIYGWRLFISTLSAIFVATFPSLFENNQYCKAYYDSIIFTSNRMERFVYISTK